MPHATSRYPFEWKIFQWSAELSLRMTGRLCGFIVIFSEDGVAQEIHFGHDENQLPPNAQGIREKYASWFMFNPFDAPEYSAIQWQNVSQAVIERIVRAPFTPDDFVSRQGDMTSFPSTWHVVF